MWLDCVAQPRSTSFALALLVVALAQHMFGTKMLGALAVARDTINIEQIVTDNRKMPVVNMLYGLHGNATGFLEEWEVSLKSLLCNAPSDADMHIHVLCNDDAAQSVRTIVNERLKLPQTRWRNRIQITAYNVDSYGQQWVAHYLNATRRTRDRMSRKPIGALYRLFANRVIPNTTHVAYLDNEIIVLKNLNALLYEEVDDTKVFYYGKNRCSGFMIINLAEFDNFWDMVRGLSQVPWKVNDQRLIGAVAKSFPSAVGALSDQWSVDMASTRGVPHKLRQKDSVAILHYNGVREISDTFWDPGLEYYCDRIEECKSSEEYRKAFVESWGLADYYIRLPWPWVKSMAAAEIPPGEDGNRLEFHQIALPPLL